MTRVDDALQELKTAVSALVVPTGQDPLTGVFVYPDEFDEKRLDQNAPYIVIEKQKGVNDQWNAPFAGCIHHVWTAVIRLYLDAGEIVYPSKDSAVQELSDDQWELAVVTALLANYRVGGAIDEILPNATGNLIQTRTVYDVGELSETTESDQIPYWAIYFGIGIVQQYDNLL